MALLLWVIAIPYISETFPPIILQRKAARLRFETKNWALHSQRDEEPVQYGYLARKYGIKPLQMLALEPILQAITVFTAVVYALIYLTFFSFPYSFAEVRGWKIGINALPFLSLFIGYLIGFTITVLESRLRFQPMLKKLDGKVAPEERITAHDRWIIHTYWWALLVCLDVGSAYYLGPASHLWHRYWMRRLHGLPTRPSLPHGHL